MASISLKHKMQTKLSATHVSQLVGIESASDNRRCYNFKEFHDYPLPKSKYDLIHHHTGISSMGQIFDKLRGKEWREKQIRKITDKVFNHFVNDAGRANLTFEDLYIAVLLVFNDLNKRLPGPHFDPPTKVRVREMIQECDVNLDGEIDRKEFVEFIRRLTEDTFIVVSQGLIITLVIAPTVAMATKRATEGVPGVGKVVQKLPNSVYASLITLAAVMLHSTLQGV